MVINALLEDSLPQSLANLDRTLEVYVCSNIANEQSYSWHVVGRCLFAGGTSDLFLITMMCCYDYGVQNHPLPNAFPVCVLLAISAAIF